MTPSERQNDSALGAKPGDGHLAVLDGWRAISILLVLACHTLPLGPKAWRLNEAAGPAGMSLFFTLSGFLICQTLWKKPDALSFLIRRFARIMPLALLAGSAILLLQGAALDFFPAHWLLYINYDLAHATPYTAHFWSLGVEVQFYVFAAVLVFGFGNRGLLLIPWLALAVTAVRVSSGATISLSTHLRVDEIFTGVTLALVWLDQLGGVGRVLRTAMIRVPLPIWAMGFAISCHPDSGWAQYFRPYLGSATVGACLLNPANHYRMLCSRPMRYIAEISYALYIIHPVSMYGWLGSGEGIVKYLKRPLSYALTFGLAHLSTFYLEKPCTDWAKRLTARGPNRTDSAISQPSAVRE